jgi:4-hydroxyphenylacetate 3-monooxygenase
LDQRSISAESKCLTDNVRHALDEVRARASEAEKARGPLAANMDLIKRLGLVRGMVPAEAGGLESNIVDWLQALRLLATADMSTAWLAGLSGAHSFVMTKFDARVQDEIWGQLGPDALVASASAIAEDGVAESVDGGVKVSGRWRFSSGVSAADWTMLLIKLKSPATGELEHYWALLPKADYTVKDSWFTVGMRGTGSNDVVVTEAVVPLHRLGGPGVLTVEEPGRTRYDNPLFDVPFRVMFPILFAPVVLGGAEGAIELYRQLLTKRRTAISGMPLIDSPLSHVKLAEAVVRLRGVAALLEASWRLIAERARTGQPMSEEDQMNARVEQAFAGREAVRTVEHVIESAGASVYSEANPLNRFWRDLHVAGGHTRFYTDLPMQVLGRSLLGLPADPAWVV